MANVPEELGLPVAAIISGIISSLDKNSQFNSPVASFLVQSQLGANLHSCLPIDASWQFNSPISFKGGDMPVGSYVGVA